MTIGDIQQRIFRMSPTERVIVVQHLTAKATSILTDGQDQEDYPGQNELWAGDLLRAAGLIKGLAMSTADMVAWGVPECCKFENINQSEAEEIEAILG